MKTFTIKPTERYGHGCFATRPIARSETIHQMNGRTIDLFEMVELVLSGGELIDDPLQVGMRTYIDLDRVSRTFNHSCDPNSGISCRSTLVAIRDIFVGEEITYDYSLTMSPTDWTMKCKCGSEMCRGILSDVSSIPRERLRFYMKSGAVQRYIRRILPAILDGTYEVPTYERTALLKLGDQRAN